jgi:hypothetical protein
MKHRISKFGILALLLASIINIWGQTSGTLSGRVTSASGAAIPNAAITITETNTGSSQRVLTGQDGNFSISNLPPGTYRVEVESSGFKRSAQNSVQLSGAAPATVNITMEAGSKSEVVEVQAQTPAVQDQSAEISRSYDGRVVRELPIQDRNHEELVGLMPGVTPPLPPVNRLQDPQDSRSWETNGQPNMANHRSLDGVENDEPVIGTSVHVPAIESVEQMNLRTGTWSADQGRTGGTALNLINRPGTNGVHGSLFEFYAPSLFRARNFFNPDPNPMPKFVSNQFGGTVGGPIIRDRMFFFGSYEGDFLRSGISQVTTVPTAALRSGNFSGVPNLTLYNPLTGDLNGNGRVQFPGNVIPGFQINPVSAAIASQLPAPNLPGLEYNYATNVPFNRDGHRVDARIDHRFTDRTTGFFRYGFSDFYVLQGAALGNFLGGGGENDLRSHTATIDLTHSFTAATNTSLRLNYNRYLLRPRGLGESATASQFGFVGANGLLADGALPRVQIAGMEPFGLNPNYPSRNVDNTWNLVNTWSKQAGRHTLKWGADAWWIRTDGWQDYLFGSQGGYTFGAGATTTPTSAGLGPYGSFANAWASFLLGAPSQTGITNTSLTPSFTSWQTSGWVGDTIQVFRRLTLDLGLRYEFFTPMEPRRVAGWSIFNPNTNQLLPIGTDTVTSRGNIDYDTNNWAPRFGFAFRAAERTVIRGGYGISYWNPPMSFFAGGFIPGNATTQLGIANGFGVGGQFGQLPASGTAQPTGSVAALNQSLITTPNSQTPYVQSFSFQIQQDLGSSAVLDLGYVGTLGRQLPYTRELNAAAPGAGVAGLPLNAAQYGFRSGSTWERGTGLTNNYNSFQANVTKRFARNVSFALAYTFSKTLDYGSGTMPFLNNLNIRSNYGPADYDRTHMVTVSHNFQLPVGAGTNHLNQGVLGQIIGNWQFAGIFRYATGMPFTAMADPALCNCPGNSATANLVGTGVTQVINVTPDIFGGLYLFPYYISNFEFQQPAPGTFGSSGRNNLRGPDLVNYNLSVFRSFSVREQFKLEIRGEAYNLTNTHNFASPISNINSVNFGRSVMTLPGYGERTLQFGVRLLF